MNQGQFYSHPLESDFNKLRRFIVSNSRVYHGMPRHIISRVNRYLNLDSCNIPGELKDGIKKGIQRSGNRHCPKCYQMGFHAEIYNSRWMLKCPVHDEILSSTCPECSFRYSNLDRENNFCSICSIIPPKIVPLERKIFNSKITYALTPYIELQEKINSSCAIVRLYDPVSYSAAIELTSPFDINAVSIYLEEEDIINSILPRIHYSPNAFRSLPLKKSNSDRFNNKKYYSMTAHRYRRFISLTEDKLLVLRSFQEIFANKDGSLHNFDLNLDRINLRDCPICRVVYQYCALLFKNYWTGYGCLSTLARQSQNWLYPRYLPAYSSNNMYMLKKSLNKEVFQLELWRFIYWMLAVELGKLKFVRCDGGLDWKEKNSNTYMNLKTRVIGFRNTDRSSELIILKGCFESAIKHLLPSLSYNNNFLECAEKTKLDNVDSDTTKLKNTFLTTYIGIVQYSIDHSGTHGFFESFDLEQARKRFSDEFEFDYNYMQASSIYEKRSEYYF